MLAATVSNEEVKRLKGIGFLVNRGTDKFSARVVTECGRVTPEQLHCVAEAAEKFGNKKILMTTRLSMEIQGVPYEKTALVAPFVEKAGLTIGGTGPLVRPVVACKGSTCIYGMIDVTALSHECHQRFYLGMRNVKLPHKFKIAVGGCPNNCVKPDLNDIGVFGCRRTPPGYRIVVGGTWGRNGVKAQPLDKIFDTQDEVLAVIEKAIYFFRDNGQPGERFAKTIARIGFEKVQAALCN